MERSRISCKYHKNSKVLDISKEGDIICSACALVLTERNYGEEKVLNKKIYDFGLSSYSIWYYCEYIQEVCERLHLLAIISNDAMTLFKMTTNKPKLKNLHKRAVAVSAIYISAKRHKVG